MIHAIIILINLAFFAYVISKAKHGHLKTIYVMEWNKDSVAKVLMDAYTRPLEDPETFIGMQKLYQQ